MRRPIVLASGIVLIALVAAGGWAGYRWYGQRDVREVEDKVRRMLKDPESARFERVTFNPAKKTGCGYVNAKNSMGGYTGSRHFIAFPDGEFRVEPEDPTESGSLDDRIAALDKRINYQKLVLGYCYAERAASAPNK